MSVSRECEGQPRAASPTGTRLTCIRQRNLRNSHDIRAHDVGIPARYLDGLLELLRREQRRKVEGPFVDGGAPQVRGSTPVRMISKQSPRQTFQKRNRDATHRIVHHKNHVLIPLWVRVVVDRGRLQGLALPNLECA